MTDYEQLITTSKRLASYYGAPYDDLADIAQEVACNVWRHSYEPNKALIGTMIRHEVTDNYRRYKKLVPIYDGTDRSGDDSSLLDARDNLNRLAAYDKAALRYLLAYNGRPGHSGAERARVFRLRQKLRRFLDAV